MATTIRMVKPMAEVRPRFGGTARRLGGGFSALLIALNVACTPGEVSGENALPTGIPDPASVQNPKGALAFYQRVVASVPTWFDGLTVTAGVLTDELAALPLPQFTTTGFTALDSRNDGRADELYNTLHRVRAQAREARGFVTSYLPDTATAYRVPALQGHLYALEGYAEIFLADLFCSGIPLSTVDYGADYTLASGSRTNEVYTHAIVLFDSALALSGDSARLQRLAAVGRGRALLALDRYAEAAAAVVGVPDDYGYQVEFQPDATHRSVLQEVANGGFDTYGTGGGPSMADGEGINGLKYRTSGDPRTQAVVTGQDGSGNDRYFPAKYPTSGPLRLTLADGIEARLIEAEALLRVNAADGRWLAKLNALRTDGTFTTRQNPDDAAKTDTLWNPGGGGVPGLRLLADTADMRARVDLLFQERAFWLYLTAHRQGDLRRLIRQYPDRTPSGVYPAGYYSGGGSSSYGTQVVVPVPDTERRLNPKYTGCIDLNA